MSLLQLHYLAKESCSLLWSENFNLKNGEFNLLISSPNRTLVFTTLTTRENLYMDTEMYEEILGFD